MWNVSIFHNHSAVMEIRKFTLVPYYCLLYRPHSNFTNCPTDDQGQHLIQNYMLYLLSCLSFFFFFQMSVSPPLIWADSLVFLCPSQPWHFWRVLANYFIQYPSFGGCPMFLHDLIQIITKYYRSSCSFKVQNLFSSNTEIWGRGWEGM